MGRPPIELDPHDLIQKYNNHMSLDEIGKFYEVSSSTIRRKILSVDPTFQFRDLRPIKGKKRMRIPMDDAGLDATITSEILHKYYEEKKNPYQIHEEMGYTVSDIHTVILTEKYSHFSREEILYGNPLSKTRQNYKCIYCGAILPEGVKRLTCNDDCLKAYRKYKKISQKQALLEKKRSKLMELKAQVCVPE